ncbi:hypothetical protein [Pleionea sediminis]|nr:hypothetical protein [Pleionea sediminis]
MSEKSKSEASDQPLDLEKKQSIAEPSEEKGQSNSIERDEYARLLF